ncbi:hypothetical protein Tco_0581408 [Tanacetum coccineum]
MGRIDAIDADEEITLVSVHDEMDVDEEVVEVINTDKLIIDVAQDSAAGDIVSDASAATTVSAATTTTATITTVDDITLAQALMKIKSTKPKEKGVVIQELGESTTTISSQLSSQQSHDKGKGILIEPVKPMKKKDQISFDEETALKLQAEFDEEKRLAREKAEKEKEANIALIETWDDIQAKIDVDHQLAERMQAQEKEELSIKEKATLFQQLLEKKRKHFADKRAKEKRNKPPTKAQQRKIMCTYLKNMEGYKLNDLKLKEFDSIQEMFDRAFKRQKEEDDKETTELKQCLEIIPDEKEVTIDAIPLAVKQDLEDLYKLVKAKYESTRPVEDLDLLLWGDLKTMFEPHIYMLVEKKYPLAPLTLSMMLEKKLIIDYESEMAYQLLKFIIKQLKKGGLLGLKIFLMLFGLLLLMFVVSTSQGQDYSEINCLVEVNAASENMLEVTTASEYQVNAARRIRVLEQETRDLDVENKQKKDLKASYGVTTPQELPRSYSKEMKFEVTSSLNWDLEFAQDSLVRSSSLAIIIRNPIFKSQEILTSNTHQQSFADASSETKPSMLERGSYIPWASRFIRYLNRKRENKKLVNKAIDEGLYEFRIFTPSETKAPRMQKEEDLRGDDLKHYEVEIEAMNLILISISNEIYNSVDVCTIAKDSYDDLFDYLQQLEKLVNASRAKKLEKSHDPLALVAHTGSSSRTTTPYYVTHLSSVVDYDDDYQGDVVQNKFKDPLTSVIILLARAITQSFSNLINNRLRTSSNSRDQAIVQGDRVNIQSKNSGNDGRNIRRSYVQEKIIEGNNVQNDAGNIQRTLRATSSGTTANDEAGVILTDEHNDFLFAHATQMEDIEELSANICLMAMIQPANIDSDAGTSYDFAFLSKVQTLSTSYVNPLFAKDNQEQKYPKQPKIINNIIGDDQIDSNIIFDEPNDDVNSSSVEDNNNAQQSYELEQLDRNAYKEAEK